MKVFLIACSLSCAALTQTFAQTNTDPNLKFDQPVTKCELKWVVVPKKDTSSKYMYGFIYVDMQAGFTFDFKGTFIIDKDGHYIGDTSMTRTKSFKYRLGPNMPKVALLPSAHFNELHIQPRPWWVNTYYQGRDTTTVDYNYRMGFNLNGAGDSGTALTYLNKAYKIDPQYKGLIFELAYAYNALTQYDNAIALLKKALESDPKNVMLFRELGYAYKLKGSFDDAINYYKQGIDLCAAGQNDSKAEMGYNLAYVYKAKGDDAGYRDMMTKVKAWASVNSEIYRAVLQQGF